MSKYAEYLERVLEADLHEDEYEIQLIEESIDAAVEQDSITNNAWVINDQPHNFSDNHVVVTCISWEKGSWEYELIETKEPFDQSKLEFFVYHIDGMFVVDHLKYDGEEITCMDGNSRGTGFDVWFG